MRQERGYLRQHLAVASLTKKRKKKEDIYLYTGKGGKGWAGATLCPLPDFTT